MGVSIIMVSSELPELMEMCDRFVVMANGEAVAEFSKEEVTEKDIMLASTKSGVM
jgi:D-xylose transport system ATP-binding protein